LCLWKVKIRNLRQKSLILSTFVRYESVIDQKMDTAVTSTSAPLTLTPGAVKELKKLKEQQELSDEFGLRVGVEGGGCAGMNYILGFDRKKEGDSEYLIEGIRIFMNKAHGLYLAGMEIDFKSGLDARGFTFNNPNATKTCGCGSSFSA